MYKYKSYLLLVNYLVLAYTSKYNTLNTFKSMLKISINIYFDQQKYIKKLYIYISKKYEIFI